MANTMKVFLGGTDGNPNDAANWTPAEVPLTGDTLVWNDQTLRACDGHDFGAADPGVLVTCIVEKGCKYAIGTSGTPLAFNQIHLLDFRGSSIIGSYFGTSATGGFEQQVDNVSLDSESQANPVLTVSGTIDRWTNRSGRGAIKSTATLDERAEIIPSGSGTVSELSIPSGVTITAGCVISIEGGVATVGASQEQVYVKGGKLILESAAAVSTRLEITGGTVEWDAQSTLALVEARGGVFKTTNARLSRILTEMNMSGDAIVDLRIGGNLITYTNGIRVFGSNQPMFPSGTKITPSVT
jgi:hypothetical protein